jgi:hypothetical protein
LDRIGKASVKYYLYISDAKVDMLIAQIPRNVKKKIATEFGFDLKVISAKRKNETEIEDNRVTRLEAVTSFIREFGNLGSVDESDEFFEGALPMRSGPMTMGTNLTPSSVIYFGGRTRKTVVGLGGSPRHIIGSIGSSPVFPIGSLSLAILDYISGHVDRNAAEMPVWSRDARPLLGEIVLMTRQLRGPQQNLEFMAKRLVSGALPDYVQMLDKTTKGATQVLLGTPLYLAMTD